MTSELIVQLITALGIPGVLVWYLYHTTTKTIPELTKTHSEGMKEVTKAFTDTLKDERSAREREITALQNALPKICTFREAK